MKNVSLLINGILFVAVSFLFYLHYRDRAPSAGEALAVVPVTSSIVYVNTDTLLEHYSYFKKKKEEFEKKSEQIKDQLNAESNRLQAEAGNYQERAAAMTMDERAKTEEQLMIKQQNLMKRKESLYSNLESEQEKFHKELYDKLSNYLAEYNKNRNYSFVFGYTKGGGILFANDSLDVTREVIEGLNKSEKQQ